MLQRLPTIGASATASSSRLITGTRPFLAMAAQAPSPLLPYCAGASTRCSRRSIFTPWARDRGSGSAAAAAASTSSGSGMSTQAGNGKAATGNAASASDKEEPVGHGASATEASTETTVGGETEQESATASAASEKVVELEKQVKELKDHYLRALADQENLRERTRKEKDLAQQLAIKSFAKDISSVADVLEIALASVPESELRQDSSSQNGVSDGAHKAHVHLKNLYEGLTMTHAELLATFKRHGVQVFDPTGDKFDPNLHQALFMAPMPDKEPGTVFNVTKKGYTLHGVVIRAAQVGVVRE